LLEDMTPDLMDEFLDDVFTSVDTDSLVKIRDLIDSAIQHRLLTEDFQPRTEAERHMREHRHVLSYGCCQSPSDDQRS
jgi:hypothetical protein